MPSGDHGSDRGKERETLIAKPEYYKVAATGYYMDFSTEFESAITSFAATRD